MSRVRHLFLDGTWKLQWFEHGHYEGQAEKNYDDSWWMDASVPGEVHEELLKRGLIKDPFFGRNVEDREWVEEVDWWYRKRFFVPEEFGAGKVELIFEGIDTFAAVWLNGRKVAESEDMFLPLVVDVTDKLLYGEYNVLSVRLGSPWRETLRRAGGFVDRQQLWNGNYSRLYARKAQYQYGWDWAARLLTVGIWRSVRLRAVPKASIRAVYARTVRLEEGSAEVEVQVEVESLVEGRGEVKVEISSGGDLYSGSREVDLHPGVSRVSLRLRIGDAKLWWPVGLGPQNLYTVISSLSVDGEEVDVAQTRFGIRTVELVTESDKAPNGKVFYFKINGVKVFAKGANWIPMDLLISRITPQRYRDLLEKAVKANHNMLRVWGGGLVEYDSFYDLCDEMGIMLWHDFQFACGAYPEDDDFARIVRREVEAIVRKLRNHPSIVLWCGNNENEMFFYYTGQGIKKHRLDFEVIPEVCGELDPSRPYWPSSPWGGEHPNSPEEGDRHNWDVYHGLRPIESYLRDEARFLSEFGMQAAPHPKTLVKFIPPGKLWPISDLWLFHCHVPEKVLPYVTRFGGPRDLYSYVFLSQLAQAEALRTAAEHCRRRKFSCGGALYWSLNAPWPNACWETIDYYGRPKMAYYFLKRAFSPVAISLLGDEGKIEVWLVNDTLEEDGGRVRILAVDVYDGKILWETSFEARVPPNSSRLAKILELGEMRISEEALDRVAIYGEYASERHTSRRSLFLAPHRDLKFSHANIELDVVDKKYQREGVELALALKSDAYARLVFLDVDEDVDFDLEDNFFDMLPGEPREVRLFLKDRRLPRITLAFGAYNSEIRKHTVDLK